jgi:NADH-quinone oxidoreductase subunit C
MADDAAREETHKPAGGGAEEEENRPGRADVDDEVAAAVLERFAESVFDRSHEQPVIYVDRAQWVDVARFLRDEQQFTQCVDLTAVDHMVDTARRQVPGVDPERFEIVANFLSHPRNRRVRAICEVPATDPEVASLTELYAGLNFAEREVFDLFGIGFVGHPDLTRILMPDDWDGFPLRKDDAPARVPVTFKEDPGPR